MKQEFSSSIVVANEYTLIGAGTVYGVATIGTTATEVKVGTEKLADRTTLLITALGDNADNIYIGFDNTVTSTHFGIVLSAGSSTQIKLDRQDNISIYAISATAGQKVAIVEGIS